ncbi:Mu transposase C-terminal domain-containing protein [Rhodococcus sp. WAY2]|uniref:Mu transposase C-terminal domain-containing protein n=1 Tax=Rhodococcus sp. WAY2 TaxID=2663121 RepID=UPI001F2E76DF|nr:Mu transposase C-terminal domain-containing protein [Rhodococcus sp. WAY2]
MSGGSAPRRPARLSIGDRVRLAGTLHTVIAVSGTRIQLADTGGQVTAAGLTDLLAAGDFEAVSAPAQAPVPPSTLLDGLPEAVAAEALWWEQHIVEVLRGIPPQAPAGTRPKPEYDPERVSLTRREQAKAAELTGAGRPVTASAITKRRRRYEARGLAGMVDHRIDKPVTAHGRADPLVVEALQQAIAEATQESSRTATYLFWRTGQILEAAHGPGAVRLPSQRSLYRLLEKLSAGKHTTGSARTRRSLADRPDGPFGEADAWAPGEVMQIDSTPLDVLVRLDDGVVGRIDLTGMIDVASRTVTAAVLRPTTKSVDASVLLARTVTPEPMRPGWSQALAMSRSALPFERLLDIDARMQHAAARPVVIPETIVVDQGKVFISRNFRASCNFLGINFQPVHDASGWEKGHIERMLGSVGTLFAQFVAGYTGFNAERRGRHVEQQAVWSVMELQELLDEWLVAAWQNRPHEGLRDPVHPGRMFSPNEKYAALVETAGYVPVALSADDYVELLPATWRAINAYGVKLSHRTYDDQALNPLRHQRSGMTNHRDLWEIHYDPYDVSRIWVRNHWKGGWITLFWKHLHRVAAPFGELAWDHTHRALPAATEEEVADAVADLLKRAHQGPSDSDGRSSAKLSRRDRRVAARTKASSPAAPIQPQPAPRESIDEEPDPVRTTRPGKGAKVIPLPIFDPFTEADKRW